MKRTGGRLANERVGEVADDDGDDVQPEAFRKASQERLAKRQLVRARKRRVEAAPAASSGGDGDGAASNPFGAVKLAPTAPAPAAGFGFSFGATQGTGDKADDAKDTTTPGTGTGGFSFGAAANGGGAQTPLTFSFGAAPGPAPAPAPAAAGKDDDASKDKDKDTDKTADTPKPAFSFDTPIPAPASSGGFFGANPAGAALVFGTGGGLPVPDSSKKDTPSKGPTLDFAAAAAAFAPATDAKTGDDDKTGGGDDDKKKDAGGDGGDDNPAPAPAPFDFGALGTPASAPSPAPAPAAVFNFGPAATPAPAPAPASGGSSPFGVGSGGVTPSFFGTPGATSSPAPAPAPAPTPAPSPAPPAVTTPAPSASTNGGVFTPSAGTPPQANTALTSKELARFEFFEDVAQLNRSMYEFVVKQYAEHPLSVWTTPCQEYINYAKTLEQQHGSIESLMAESGGATTPAPSTAPASNGGAGAGAGAGASAEAAVTAAAAAASAPPTLPTLGGTSDGKDTAAFEGEDKIVLEQRAKLYRFKKDEQEWADMGVGTCRILSNPKMSRIVFRSTVGKLLLNSILFSSLTYKRAGKAGVEMILMDESTSEMQKYLLRVKTPDLANRIKVAIDSHKAK